MLAQIQKSIKSVNWDWNKHQPIGSDLHPAPKPSWLPEAAWLPSMVMHILYIQIKKEWSLTILQPALGLFLVGVVFWQILLLISVSQLDPTLHSRTQSKLPANVQSGRTDLSSLFFYPWTGALSNFEPPCEFLSSVNMWLKNFCWGLCSPFHSLSKNRPVHAGVMFPTQPMTAGVDQYPQLLQSNLTPQMGVNVDCFFPTEVKGQI